MNSGEEMLQLTGTDDSFRSIASWLFDNIVSMQEKMYLQLDGIAVICLFFFTSKIPPSQRRNLGLIRFFENFESILLNGQILNLAALPIDFGSRGSQGSTGHI
jgi:hypothetical protein